MSLQRTEFAVGVKTPYLDRSGSEDIPIVIENMWKNPLANSVLRNQQTVEYWQPLTTLPTAGAVYTDFSTPIMHLALSSINTLRIVQQATTPVFNVTIQVYQGSFLETLDNDPATTHFLLTQTYALVGIANTYRMVSLVALPFVFLRFIFNTAVPYAGTNLLCYLHTEVNL